jgi:hypothetical protein
MDNYNLFDAKNYFKKIMKEHLIPVFELNGYRKVKTNHWEKSNEEINIKIQLQKSSSNTKTGILFCFNISISLMMKNGNNPEESFLGGRQDQFLTSDRLAFKEKNHQAGWYLIFRNENEYNKMLQIVKNDFEEYIFPILDKINRKELERMIQKENNEKGHIWYINEFIE